MLREDAEVKKEWIEPEIEELEVQEDEQGNFDGSPDKRS